MSTLSVIVTDRTVGSNKVETFGTVTGGTSDYTNGTGYIITAAQLGLFHLDQVRFTNNVGALIPQWTVSSNTITLKVYNPTGGAGSGSANTVTPGTFTGTLGTLAATATPASGMTAVTSTSAQPAIPVVFTGVPGGSETAGAINPGPGSEVASSTDLSSVKFAFIAIGQ